jgi:dolichol-phosphate mannosyltransferase
MIRFASTGIFYFSKKPLQIATTFGFFSVAAGLFLSLWVFINKLLTPQYSVSGWTSLVLLTIYFGGVQLLTIGILGHYIGSLFDEVKKRPEYIIDQQIRAHRMTVTERQAADTPSSLASQALHGTTQTRSKNVPAAPGQHLVRIPPGVMSH